MRLATLVTGSLLFVTTLALAGDEPRAADNKSAERGSKPAPSTAKSDATREIRRARGAAASSVAAERRVDLFPPSVFGNRGRFGVGDGKANEKSMLGDTLTGFLPDSFKAKPQFVPPLRKAPTLRESR